MYPSGVSTQRWLERLKSTFSALTSFSQGKTSSRCASRIFVLPTPGRAMIGIVPPHCILVSAVQLRPSKLPCGKSGRRTVRLFWGIPSLDVNGLSAIAPRPRPANFRKSRRETGRLDEGMRPRITVNGKEVNQYLNLGLKRSGLWKIL